MKLSLIIPAKDKNDPKLADLLRSIEAQDFPKDQMEVLVITEGTSESAKAIGIRKAKGDVIGILASDNEFVHNKFLSFMYKATELNGSAFPAYYHIKGDMLNRYFALIGGNDPLSFYLNKNDRLPYFKSYSEYCSCRKSLGDNGFFIKKEIIYKTNLNAYYHVDNACETRLCPMPVFSAIFHNTGGNIFSFFKKRYRYGLQHAFNKNRRWHLVDFNNKRDIWKLLLFIFYTLTLLQPLCLSLRGYLKIRDRAWFLHPIVCLGTLFTYALVVVSLPIRNLQSQLSSAPMDARRA